MLGKDVQSSFGNRSPVGVFYRDIPGTGQSLDASILKNIYIDSERLLHVRFHQANGQTATHVAVQPFQSRDFALVKPKVVSLSSNQVDNIEIALDLDITDLNGFIYTIFQDIIGGKYDISSNIEPIQDLWSYDENGIPINSSNGRKILGRQDFPPLFEVENSILVIEATRLHDIQVMLDSGQACGFMVKQSKITINSEKDLILAKAMIHIACQS
ncbi:MAG: hypothetical protein HQK65_14625 [Desulfamplus sp.]|nr:hypothetical protein [Desulfamplus sp.]